MRFTRIHGDMNIIINNVKCHGVYVFAIRSLIQLSPAQLFYAHGHYNDRMNL